MRPVQFRRMSIIGCLVVLAVTSSASGWARPATATASVASSSKAETSGLAAGVGMGYQTPVFGGQVLYYFRMGERPISVAPYAGVAVWPDVDRQSGKLEVVGTRRGLALGCMVVRGRRHRFVADVSFGLAGVEYQLFPVTQERESNEIYGLSAAFGYEFMARWGFFFRATGGLTYLLEEPQFAVGQDRGLPTFHLGVGYKFF